MPAPESTTSFGFMVTPSFLFAKEGQLLSGVSMNGVHRDPETARLVDDRAAARRPTGWTRCSGQVLQVPVPRCVRGGDLVADVGVEVPAVEEDELLRLVR